MRNCVILFLALLALVVGQTHAQTIVDVNQAPLDFDQPTFVDAGNVNNDDDDDDDDEGGSNAVGEGAVLLYENVFDSQGISFDAIVTFVSIDGGTCTDYDNTSSTQNNEARWFSPRFDWNSGGGQAEIEVAFIESGSVNNPQAVAFNGFLLNSYDLDGGAFASGAAGQYTDLQQFESYTLGKASTLNVIELENYTRFQSAFNQATDADSDQTRLYATFGEVSTMTFRLGASGSGAAYYFVDFSEGLQWTEVPDPVVVEVACQGNDLVISGDFLSDVEGVLVGGEEITDFTVLNDNTILVSSALADGPVEITLSAYGQTYVFASVPVPGLGCTDATACNYDEDADCDDGSCTYIPEGACNCAGDVIDACGACGGTGVAGCTDMEACNYDASATCDDESCTYIPEGACNCAGDVLDACGACGGTGVAGCTDMEACNYDASATCDDESCTYIPEGACNCAGDLPDACGECGGNSQAGCTDTAACNYDASATCDDDSCTYITGGICNCDGDVEDECGECGGNGVAGCMDAAACNYNADATCDDESCTYIPEGTCNCEGQGMSGCTDTEACNYDDHADCDNGTCTYVLDGFCDCDGNIEDGCGECGGSGVAGCTDTAACNYDATATCDDDSCTYIGGGICDCDGNVLDECGECGGPGAVPWYADSDGDGVGVCDDVIMACEAPEGYVDECGDECPNNPAKVLPMNCGCDYFEFNTHNDVICAEICCDEDQALEGCPDVTQLCGVGTVWDPTCQQCVCAGPTCYGDINLDGVVQLGDLLDLLSVYGNVCSEEH